MRSHRSFARRLAFVLPLAGVTLAAAGVAAAAPSGTTSASGAAASTASTLRFASPTVVDEFVPGFEPDVVQDPSHAPSRGRYYSSWPNGFSSTISYLERSDDGANSFHRVAGSLAGKAATCVGGGDSELQVNGKDGQLLFADLQGLTNFSTSASTDGGNTFSTQCAGVKGTGVDRQWIAVDDNGGTSPIGAGATDGRAYLFYDNVAQNTSTDNTDNTAGNSPVVNATTDGVNYGGCVDAAATVCDGPAPPISDSDDIVGNAFVDNTVGGPRQHTVYEVRGATGSHSVLLSSCRGAKNGTATTAAATAGLCTSPLSPPTAGGSLLKNTNWTDHVVAKLPTGYVAKSFDVGAIDTAGNVYVTWAQYKLNPDMTYASTGQIELAYSKDGGATFSAPRQLNPPSQPTVIFPWIAAGDPGRVDVAWYSAPQRTGSDGKSMGPDSLDNGTWSVSYAQSVNLFSGKPTFAEGFVSDHIVKYSGISTGGLGGSADRSLGDYLQAKTGNDGQAVVSYVDDTSGNRNNDVTMGSGQDPPEAAGPTMSAKQIAGPSLYAVKGSVGTGVPATGSVTDPIDKGFPDSYLAFAGANTSASKALDIGGVSITQPDAKTLTITMKTADPALAEDLAPDPSLGGSLASYANWRVRWAGRYGSSGKDGQIYYVGMQAGPDGTPSYYVGKTASVDSTRTKYFAYPTGTTVAGKITGSTITWTVPAAAVGNPVKGDGLYSVTGFTATAAIPDMPIATTLPTGTGQVGSADSLVANLIDAAPSFSYVVGSAVIAPGGTTGGTGLGGGTGTGGGTVRGGGSGTAGGALAFTGLGTAVPVVALVLVGGGVALRRRRRRD